MDALTQILAGLDEMRAGLAALYQDLHRNPELSWQESRTASIAAAQLRAEGYSVTAGGGKNGVVGILENGTGPTVMVRADMDALPVREQTGLAYASVASGVDGDGEPVPIMPAGMTCTSRACAAPRHCSRATATAGPGA